MSAAADVLATLKHGVPPEDLDAALRMLRPYTAIESPIDLGGGPQPGFRITFHELTTGLDEQVYEAGEHAFVRQRADGLFVLWHEDEPWDD